MEPKYIAVWDFVFIEICDQKRRVDVTEKIVKTGDTVVYVEMAFADGKNGKSRPGYSGRFYAVEVEQMLGPYPGLKRHARAILIKEVEKTEEMKKKIEQMINDLDKEGGLLPLPAPVA